MKFIGHTSACNNLTNFQNGAKERTRNENYVNLLKFAWKSHEIVSDELIFGGFKPFEITVCN